VADQLKARVADPSGGIALPAREVVIQADHLFAGFHQRAYEVRPHKSGTAGHQIARD